MSIEPTVGPARPPGRPSALGRALLACVALGLCGAASTADELQLRNGSIEGRLIEEGADVTRIETFAGELAVPMQAIVRRIPGESRLERYRKLRGEAPLTPERERVLARWCRQEGLSVIASGHISAALAADPASPEARQLAGYVRLGDVWIQAGTPAAPHPARARPPDALIREMLTGWQRRFNKIEEVMVQSARGSAEFEGAREMLLSLRAPLSVQPACRILGGSAVAVRLVLVEFLQRYPQDDATVHLVVLALWDAQREVRRSAARALRTRRDARPTAALARALQCNTESIVLNAAEAIAQTEDRSAVPALIDALCLPRGVTPPLDPRPYFDDLLTVFDGGVPVPLGETAATHPSTIAFRDFRRTLDGLPHAAPAAADNCRTEVQDALIALTGENFGFDVIAWRNWSARNPSSPDTRP